MGERTSYESGTFSWADLATTDPAGAKAFYAGLFGWEFDDMPFGGGGTYTMCRIDGKHVAALSGQRDEERDQGVPPHWNNYVTVHDIDARAARVTELERHPDDAALRRHGRGAHGGRDRPDRGGLHALGA